MSKQNAQLEELKRGASASFRQEGAMRRKPDILWVLVMLLSVGIVTTGYTQSLNDRQLGEIVTDHTPLRR